MNHLEGDNMQYCLCVKLRKQCGMGRILPPIKELTVTSDFHDINNNFES